eukprot:2130495-Rhodomonas_salina.1
MRGKAFDFAACFCGPGAADDHHGQGAVGQALAALAHVQGEIKCQFKCKQYKLCGEMGSCSCFAAGRMNPGAARAPHRPSQKGGISILGIAWCYALWYCACARGRAVQVLRVACWYQTPETATLGEEELRSEKGAPLCRSRGPEVPHACTGFEPGEHPGGPVAG